MAALGGGALLLVVWKEAASARGAQGWGDCIVQSLHCAIRAWGAGWWAGGLSPMSAGGRPSGQ